ncbi:MAG: hypothetical protein Q8O00_09270 [Holophaga sp.]|nr:hypothetical protein [Holophaga sp.]
MSFTRAWIPAIAGIALFIGCDSKPADKIPLTAPTAIKEPHEVLKHLQYMSVRKDMKHTSLIIPADPEIIYGSAWWFNKHAGALGIAYTEAEISTFGLEPLNKLGYVGTASSKELQAALDQASVAAQSAPKKGKVEAPVLPANLAQYDKDKLDELPGMKFPDGRPNPDYTTVKENATLVRAALAGGLYRVMRGVPAEVWPDVTVMEVKINPTNTKVQDVYLGYGGKSIMQVSVFQEAPGKNWTVSYVYYKVGLKALQSTAAKLKEQAK